MVHSISNLFPSTQLVEELQFSSGNWKKGQPRKFTTKIEEHEVSDIKYILERLSKKSLIGLLKEKRELKKRGEKLDHLHPLTFFMGVLSSRCVHFFYDLRARGGMPLDEFIKGAVESFHDERRHSNITDQQLQTFSKITQRNLTKIRSFAASNDWLGLIRWL